MRNELRNLSFTTLLLAACGAQTEPTEPAPADARVTVESRAQGILRVTVDATDEASWVELSLADPGQSPGDAWHVAFSRFRVKIDGGVSGDGGVEVAPLPFVGFEEVERAPAGGYLTDAAKTEPDEQTPDFVPDEAIDFAFSRPHAASDTGWYDYNPMGHVLAPADVTYVVATGDGRFYALRFVDYYDAAGTPGVITFDLRAVPGPEREQVLDATAQVGLRIVDGQTTDPALGGWDLLVERTWFATASGVSADGFGGARWAPEGLGFDEITAAPTTGYAEDALLPLPGPPGSGTAPGNPVLNAWYDYDPITHSVSPEPGVLLVRGRAGDYAKLRIEAYADGVFTLTLAALPPAPEEAALSVPTSTAGFVLVDLSAGTTSAPVADPSAHEGWDLAVSADAVWTVAGAQQTQDLDAIEEAPAAGFVPDEGAGESRANPTLAAAIEGATVTAVLPTADEGFAKAVLRREQDSLRIEYVFTGPGRRIFR